MLGWLSAARPSLPREPGAAFLARQLARKHLQQDATDESLVLGQIHLSQAAPIDLFQDRVMRQGLANHPFPPAAWPRFYGWRERRRNAGLACAV
jgi:hypothetical protein